MLLPMSCLILCAHPLANHVYCQAPVALDIRSPMDLVYECFVKLGLRYICVLRDGKYAGMIHKKHFVKYMRELEKEEGHG